MAEKKVGALVKEARTAAKLTQEKLARAAGENLTAADISRCEQGKADLTAAQLKKIAVACGVTQTSLVNAPKNISASAAKKTSSAKDSSKAKSGAAKSASAAKKAPASKAGTAKASSSKTSGASKKKTEAAVPASANISMKVTSTEQKLIQAYRSSTSDRKKAALKLLNGDYGDTIDKILSVTNGSVASSSSASSAADGLGDMIGSLLGGLLGGK
ncbi:MAG: helix-turn-helix transcriptional regulator [Clostridia bacterium]|nr:helix-turn-helix transcriptional regulator [Clostridia bacterium]